MGRRFLEEVLIGQSMNYALHLLLSESLTYSQRDSPLLYKRELFVFYSWAPSFDCQQAIVIPLGAIYTAYSISSR